MEKAEIVRRLLAAGVLVTPAVLEQARDEDLPQLLASKDAIVVSLPKRQAMTVELPEEKDTLTIEDFIAFYREKYEGMRQLLLGKVDAQSISTLGRQFTDVAVIVKVGEQTAGGFVGEDPTGRVEVLAEKRPHPGDVVGVRGVMREGALVAREIMYPDVPLPKTIPAADREITLSSRGQLKVVSDGEEAAIPATPARVRISGINVLVFEGEGDPREWLRKRHLPETIRSPKDTFLINDVPAILWIIGGESGADSYKGVTIVQTSRGKEARVDLRTREVVFEDVQQ